MTTSKEEKPSDWRHGGYREGYERVPRPPRTPSPLARDLIYGYQGSQGALRTIGLVFLAISFPIMLFIGDGLTTDVALGLSKHTTAGSVTGMRVVTSVEINDRNPTEIQYTYEFSGEKFAGVSYTIDHDIVSSARSSESVSIEVWPTIPSCSRVYGTTRSKMGLGALFFFLFPAVGAGMLAWAVRSNRREIRAFRDGVATKGLVKSRDFDHNTEVNGKHPYQIVWEFQIDGTNYQGKMSHMDREILDRALPEDEVTVLYDQRNPTINTVWID